MVDVLLTVFLIAAIALIAFAYGSENARIRKEMKNDRS